MPSAERRRTPAALSVSAGVRLIRSRCARYAYVNERTICRACTTTRQVGVMVSSRTERFLAGMGFPDAENGHAVRSSGTALRHAERAYRAVLRHLPWPVLRHLPWPVLRHAERNFFVRQRWLFDTPATQPVAGRRHLPKRCFGSGCARPVATRTPALMAGFNVVPCPSAARSGVGTCVVLMRKMDSKNRIYQLLYLFLGNYSPPCS